MPGLKRPSTMTTPGGAGGAKRRKKNPVSRAVVSTARALTTSHRILNTKQNVTLRYAESGTAVGIAGGSASYVYRANGLFDPNATGIGHQPRGFDQLMTLYDHYLVKFATIEVWASNENNSPGILSIITKDDGVTLPVSIDVMEDTYATHTLLYPADERQASYARFTVDIKKFLGGKDISEMKGTSASDPSEQVFFVVCATQIDTASAPSFKWWTRITYNADLIEPKQPVSS